MIRSMTGFARQDQQYDWGSLVWEVRSLNHRYLEVNVRLPEEMRQLEAAVRERVAKQLNRGKVECNLRFARLPGALCEVRLNREQAGRIIQLHSEATELLHDSSSLRPMELLRWPGIVEEAEADLGSVREQAVALFDSALTDLLDNRQREGESLKSVVQSRCHAINEIVAATAGRLPEIREHARQRLLTRVRELDVELDSSRLEQEIVMQLHKMDVDEELDRLQTHVKEVLDVLERNEPVGRRLDFLMQELNREANTLGSKSITVESTAASVDLKVLIEQMREQIQNIE